MRRRTARLLGIAITSGALTVVALACAGAGSRSARATSGGATQAEALAAFATVKRVLQHPRCQNCHIPGDAPLQFDDARAHAQNVLRGPEGRGAAGLSCSACHGEQNPPESWGEHMPPGAPNWHLPPPSQRMVFIGLSAAELAETIKDPKKNGGRDLAAMLEHVAHDKLVLWGWDPGVGRAPVDVPHSEFVAAFQKWVDGGAPTPER